MLNARFPYPTHLKTTSYAPAKPHAAPIAANYIVFAVAALSAAGAATMLWLDYWVSAIGH